MLANQAAPVSASPVMSLALRLHGLGHTSGSLSAWLLAPSLLEPTLCRLSRGTLRPLGLSSRRPGEGDRALLCKRD